MRVLHASPHPDDELIGAPATLMALRDSGGEVVNFACSLGRPADVPRRRMELREACHRARFTLVEARRLVPPMSSTPPAERDAIERRLADELSETLDGGGFDLVLGPSPHDRHPGHEIVGRAVRGALESCARPLPWWMWSLWGELPFPTVLVPFDDARLDEILAALGAHAGEVSRNDYRDLVAGRGRAARVLGAELVFGFGSPGIGGRYAEMLCEAVPDGERWLLGRARVLEPDAPFARPTRVALEWWLRARSAADLLRAEGEAVGDAPG